ncbi:MAG: class I SAM-dependent methyltransferase [Gammaproteobacteria bacterium]|nr:class I SAM-dependent methyltransferase [Gammaproteobacteria bacterium]
MSSALFPWLNSAQGRALRVTEAQLLDEALEDCFGWEALQVGAWGADRDLLRAARTRSQTLVASRMTARSQMGVDQSSDIECRLTQLPIVSDSVDAVILPHTLEFESDPYALLREVDRVLTGEGKLLILGFSPWSPWGLRAQASRSGFPPGLRRLISERRLRDWLKLLGYDVLEQRKYLHELPWGEPIEPSYRMQRGMFYLLPGGAYLLKAKKRLHTLTPLRPRLLERRRSSVLGGLTEPSSANRSKS